MWDGINISISLNVLFIESIFSVIWCLLMKNDKMFVVTKIEIEPR